MVENNGPDTNSHEPTVLDWLKSLLQLRPMSIPVEEAPKEKPVKKPKKKPTAPTRPVVKEELVIRIKVAYLRLPVAFILAFIAQFRLEQRAANTGLSIGLYLAAVVLAGWALWIGDVPLEVLEEETEESKKRSVKLPYLISGSLFAVFTYFTSGGNQFRPSTIIFWSGSLIMMLMAFWEVDISLSDVWKRANSWFAEMKFQFTLDGWKIILLLSFALGAYFRLAQLDQVPYEMWSDHAEKILDIVDVLNGRYSIFFPRNAGREAFQFYLTAAAVKWFGAELTFLTLKSVTALAGVFSLPIIYLFGREIGGRRLGLTAMLLAGIAYWPNVISRVGMRLPFHPLFLALALYFLARGFRLRRRNDMLLCGIAVGLGLFGYTAARITPIVVVIGVGLYILHCSSPSLRRQALGWLFLIGIMAVVVSMPLLRVMIEFPDQFLYRTVTRVGSVERELPGSALNIFLSNLWNGLRMFSWDNGVVWVLSIPNRPALDWVTGALFNLGIAMFVVRYIRKRNWLDPLILISIPILLLPSVLSLAFPSENPHLSRAGGAILPVFVIAAFPLAMIPDLVSSFWKGRGNRVLGIGLTVGLFLFVANMNYQLVMQDFSDQHRLGTWNTTDVGRVVRGFAESIGSYETAHVVPYPHWMDTRLVGMIAGKPTVDYALWSKDFEVLLTEQRAQMLILNPNDQESLNSLKQMFPSGTVSHWVSQIEGKDFIIYLVPPGSVDQNPVTEPE